MISMLKLRIRPGDRDVDAAVRLYHRLHRRLQRRQAAVLVWQETVQCPVSSLRGVLEPLGIPLLSPHPLVLFFGDEAEKYETYLALVIEAVELREFLLRLLGSDLFGFCPRFYSANSSFVRGARLSAAPALAWL